MDPNQSGGLSSYFHHAQQQPPPPPLNPTAGGGGIGTNTSPTNGIMPNTSNPAASPATPTTTSSPMAYGTAPSVVTSGGGGLESGKRKRGRPRKYGSPGEAAAARRLASASNAAPISPPKKKDLAFSSGAGGSTSSASAKKYNQLTALGSTGQSFIPHVITVAAGEDVGQKIMIFMQQSKRELCVLSASGSISNASLRQPATSGGSVTYEGRFDILSLCGSYVRTELGGRTGGLSVCLSSNDGQIVGGGVGGPLTAAGPIQVIVGTFLIDPKKDVTGGLKGDTSTGKSPSPIGGASFSGLSFWSPIDSSYQILVAVKL